MITTVRKADLNDSQDIFTWRNDEHTRNMSHTSDLIEWHDHCQWYANSLTNQNRLLIICEAPNKTKIAIVRFDLESHQRALISINLSPSARGKGLSKACLSKAIEFFKTLFPNVSVITAEIKSINEASQRAFESLNFILIKESDKIRHYECII